jgi:hypothetical protein
MRDQFIVPLGGGYNVLEEMGSLFDCIEVCGNVRGTCTKFGLVIIGLLFHCHHVLVGGVE